MRPDWSTLFPGAAIRARRVSPTASRVSIDTGGAGDILLVPPLSGHPATLLFDIAAACLDRFRVHVLEIDPPDAVAGRIPDIGIDGQIRDIRAARSGLAAHALLLACQAAAPGLLALEDAPPPRRLALLAPPIMPPAEDAGIAAQIARDGPDAVARRVARLAIRTGTGRLALPGTAQLAAIFAGRGGAARRLALETARGFCADPGLRHAAMSRAAILCQPVAIEMTLLLEGLSLTFDRRPYLTASSRERRPDCPTLLIAGGRDSVVPPQGPGRARKLFSRAHLEIVAGADHFDLFSGPDSREAGAILSDFCAV